MKNRDPITVCIFLESLLLNYTDNLNWQLKPDVLRCLMQLRDLRLILLSHLSEPETQRFLTNAGIKRDIFAAVLSYRDDLPNTLRSTLDSVKHGLCFAVCGDVQIM